MRSIWIRVLWCAIAATLLTGVYGGITSWRLTHPKAHTFSASGPSPYAFYDNLRSQGQYWVTDPIYGGKCDGVTDDQPAFTAAIAAAGAANGVVIIPQSATACMVASEILLNKPLPIQCSGANVAQCVIRASAPMRSVIALLPNFCPLCPGGGANEFDGSGVGWLRGITIDANSLASSAVIAIAAEHLRMTNVRLQNAPYACVRQPNNQIAVTVGAVVPSVPGGSPPGVTIAQADPNFSFPFASPATIVLQVAAPGALNTATYKVSVDGGGTFSTATMPIASLVNIPIADTVVRDLTGFQAAFPAGTYHTGDTYTVVLTWTNGVYNEAPAFSGDAILQQVWSFHCGSAYATSGFNGGLGGNYYGGLVAGTAATTTGNPRIVGTGTSWMSMTGAGTSRIVVKVDAATPVVYGGLILDDHDINVWQLSEPVPTASGLDFQISLGGGIYQEGLNEGGWQFEYGNSFGQCSVCGSYGTGRGPNLVSSNLISCATAGMSFGGGNSDSASGTTLVHPHGNSGAAVHGSVPYYFAPNSVGHIEQPMTDIAFGGFPLSWSAELNGVATPLIPGVAPTYRPIAVLTLQTSALALTSAAQQIQAPVGQGYAGAGSPTTSWLDLTPTASFVMTGTPVVTPPAQPGITLYLRNISLGGFSIQINSDASSSSGIGMTVAHVIILPQQVLQLVSSGPQGLRPSWEAMALSL